MKSQKPTQPVEVKPQIEKKVWATPVLEIIGTDDIEAGSVSKGPEHAKTTVILVNYYHS